MNVSMLFSWTFSCNSSSSSSRAKRITNSQRLSRRINNPNGLLSKVISFPCVYFSLSFLTWDLFGFNFRLLLFLWICQLNDDGGVKHKKMRSELRNEIVASLFNFVLLIINSAQRVNRLRVFGKIGNWIVSQIRFLPLYNLIRFSTRLPFSL